LQSPPIARNFMTTSLPPTHGPQSSPRNGRCFGPAIFLAIALVAGVFSAGCGYQVAGKAAHLPSEWKTIAIPAFTNDTTRYRVEQRVTQAVIREFISRTKYRIVQNPESADAVLHGEVLSIDASPVLFNGTTGEVTTMLVTMTVKVQLVDSQTQKVVFKNDSMLFRNQYQISSDVKSFFEEQDPALERMSRDFAAQIVANITENF
jgi:outer membrane lipopolysaccharide assembly protein LptE/RlpB